MIKKYLFLFPIILCFTGVAKAGTCTTGALAAASARSVTITVCKYVDYISGADTNSGDTELLAWKHAPGMLSLTPSNTSNGDACTNNCSSFTTSNAGTGIILKGGTVWPNTVLPWQPANSGSATTSATYGCQGANCAYIGYDASWNQGKVNSVTLRRDLGGCNPASPPTVAFSGGGGTLAAATANVIPAAAGTAEPQVAGFLYHVTVTNQGSGYTSAPSVTITGGGCIGITAVADITRPIIDAGGGSGVVWNVGFGAGATQLGPGLVPQGASFLVVDNMEVRNIKQVARAVNGVADGIQTSMLGAEGGGSGHITYSGNYVHGRFTNCVLISCITGWPANDQEQADKGIQFNNANDEIVGNVLENGDAYETGTASTTCSTNTPCIFSEADIGGAPGIQGGFIHGNFMYSVRWLGHVGGSGATPLIENNNEYWLVLYDVGSAHVNAMYVESTTGTNYLYNNVVHNCVSGSSNQQQMGNGTTQWIFNNLWWACPGTGTVTYGIDVQQGAGASGGVFHFYNNTMLYEAGTQQCLTSGSGSPSFLTVTTQNNFCISNQNPYFGIQQAGAVWKNQAGSTVTANIQAASQVTTLGTATTQGYAVSNLYSPTASGNDTVTFAAGSGTSNLTSLCSGTLVALCSDINGNSRPASGGWQAGAYQFGSSGSVSIAPTTFSYGTVTIGSSANSSGLVLTNSSGSTITFTGTTYTGANASDWTSASNTCTGTLATAGTCTVVAKFSPTAVAGTHETATLNVAYTGFAGGPQTVALDGTAGAPSVVTPPAPAPQIFTGTFTDLPLPATPTPVNIVASAPLKSYHTSKGWSQDGLTFITTLPLNLAGSNIAGKPTCSIDGTSVPCACGSATSCVLSIPSGAMALPTASTDHVWSISFPGVTPAPIPVLN